MKKICVNSTALPFSFEQNNLMLNDKKLCNTSIYFLTAKWDLNFAFNGTERRSEKWSHVYL